MKHSYTDGAFALVVRGDKFLLTNTHFKSGNFWSIPGGVVEPGETPAEGAAREVLEETGITCAPIRLIHEIGVDVTNDLHLSFFLAKYVSGEITIDGSEIEAAEWFRESDLSMLDFVYDNTLQVIKKALASIE